MMKFSRISPRHIAKYCFRKNLQRWNSSQSEIKSLVHLNQRSLICLKGDEVMDFLQGLITNDIRHLKEGAKSIYSVFLNNKGRVLYDSIIYKAQKEEETFYIECDYSIIESLLKHLKMYKLRRRVGIEAVHNKKKIWAIYSNTVSKDFNSTENITRLEENIVSYENCNNICIYNDPRIPHLGSRLITNTNVTDNEIKKYVEPNIVEQENIHYKIFRYELGIAEGVQDIPPGTAFPLEINCDYLHGVSFHKGCYIGQELTARTHHTGVVRKRLMPLIFHNIPDQMIEYDDKILNETGKLVGKIRGQEGIVGLGLVRHAEAFSCKTLTVKNSIIEVKKPLWWPQELHKIEVSLKTSQK